MLRVARFLREFRRSGGAGVTTEEVALQVAGTDVEGTLYRPPGGRRVPAWIVLHGVTVPGRHHESLERFCRSFAAAGNAVLVPDIPAWRRLEVRSWSARETIEGSLAHLRAREDVDARRPGVVGFSFGATHALIAASHPSLRDELSTVVGFGGYASLQRVVRCMCTGEHEWGGAASRLDPDPYGRWILAANYLTHVPAYATMTRVADAARALASEAGARRTAAWEAIYDERKATLAEGMTPEEREVWEAVAPSSDAPPPDLERVRSLADDLTRAALALDPDLEPSRAVAGVSARVVLAHGASDRLIPYTETLRMRTLLPPRVDASHTITRLFAHSTAGTGVRALEAVREGVRFARLLHRALR